MVNYPQSVPPAGWGASLFAWTDKQCSGYSALYNVLSAAHARAPLSGEGITRLQQGKAPAAPSLTDFGISLPVCKGSRRKSLNLPRKVPTNAFVVHPMSSWTCGAGASFLDGLFGPDALLPLPFG